MSTMATTATDSFKKKKKLNLHRATDADDIYNTDFLNFTYFITTAGSKITNFISV